MQKCKLKRGTETQFGEVEKLVHQVVFRNGGYAEKNW